MALELEVLTFDVEGKRFGVRSTHVAEVLRAVAISQVPQAPAALEGVLNLRGRIVPILDLRKLLGFNEKPLHHSDHLLVLQFTEHCVAVRVDRAIDLLALAVDADGVESNRQTENPSALVEFVAKTSDGIIEIINPQRLLSAVEMESLVWNPASAGATEITS